MLDAVFRPLVDPALYPVAKMLAKTRVNPDHVTVAGLVIGLVGCAFLAYGHGYVALVCLLLNRAADGLDGPLARARALHESNFDHQGDKGGFIDIVFDFIVYAAYPLAAAIGIATDKAYLAAAFVTFGFVCAGTSFLAYALIAEKKGLIVSSKDKPAERKGFFQTVGLMEGTEILIFLSLICLFPQLFVPLAWIFGMLYIATCIARVLQACEDFK